MWLIIKELGGWEFRPRKVGASWQESQSFMAGKLEKQGLGLRQGTIMTEM